MDFFCFVKLQENTPYIIITHPVALNTIERNILTAFLHDDSNYEYYIDTTSIEEITQLWLYYYDDSRVLKSYEIKRKGTQQSSFLQSDYVVQLARKNGRGIQEIVHPIQAFYRPMRYQAFIILKCSPIDSQSVFLKTKKGFGDAAIPAHRLKSYESWEFSGIPNDSIPHFIANKSDTIADRFLLSLPYYQKNSAYERAHHSIVSLTYNRNNIKERYYCMVVSYGSKGYASEFYLFNQSGEILQKIKGTKYVDIIGVTDVDRDGSNELVMLYSVGGYSGGIELLTLEECGSSGQIHLVSKIHLGTYFD